MTLGNEKFTKARDHMKVIRVIIEIIVIAFLLYLAITNLLVLKSISLMIGTQLLLLITAGLWPCLILVWIVSGISLLSA
jgi:hypothetical protein